MDPVEPPLAEPAAPVTAAPAGLEVGPPESWWALAAYLAVGFGVFLLASLGVGLAVHRQINIFTSAALYGVNFLCFAGTAAALGVWRRKLTWAEFGLRPFSLGWLMAALALAIAVLPLRALAAFLVEGLRGTNFNDMQLRMDLIAPTGPLALNFIVTLVGAGVLAPIAEEFYFRGLLFRWFRSRFSFWPAVLVSSAIFAAGHADSLGVVASSFVLGLVLAGLYDRSRSLWLTIAVHAANNSLAVVLLYAALALKLPLR
jgi:membrane protease YdiL (CAAX protease family)